MESKSHRDGQVSLLRSRQWKHHSSARVSEDDPGPTAVLNHETCLSVVSSQATDRSRQMVAMESLDIVNLERFLCGAKRLVSDGEEQ